MDINNFSILYKYEDVISDFLHFKQKLGYRKENISNFKIINTFYKVQNYPYYKMFFTNKNGHNFTTYVYSNKSRDALIEKYNGYTYDIIKAPLEIEKWQVFAILSKAFEEICAITDTSYGYKIEMISLKNFNEELEKTVTSNKKYYTLENINTINSFFS